MPPSGVEVRSIKHTGSIRDNIKRYTDLVLQVPDMSERNLLFNFISNLSPWAKQQVKLQKLQDLAVAINVAELLVDVEYVKSDLGKQKGPSSSGGYNKAVGKDIPLRLRALR